MAAIYRRQKIAGAAIFGRHFAVGGEIAVVALTEAADAAVVVGATSVVATVMLIEVADAAVVVGDAGVPPSPTYGFTLRYARTTRIVRM